MRHLLVYRASFLSLLLHSIITTPGHCLSSVSLDLLKIL
uniref:Uncharacterized protein n=1 Tax=Anguilla anguilla TaxID=7936 RepID=A0A0E9T9U5_ANGAN